MKKLAVFLVLALAALAIGACGGGGGDNSSPGNETSGGGESQAEQGSKEESGGPSASTLKFEADPSGELAYTTTKATAKAGKVTIDFKNPEPLTHNVTFESSSGKLVGETQLITDSSTSNTLNFKPGTYTFYCSVPGHREAGMEGTLTIVK